MRAEPGMDPSPSLHTSHPRWLKFSKNDGLGFVKPLWQAVAAFGEGAEDLEKAQGEGAKAKDFLPPAMLGRGNFVEDQNALRRVESGQRCSTAPDAKPDQA